MNPLQLSAQFAAYLWFVKQPANAAATPADAHRFARRNWEDFLPHAADGVGRLLRAAAKLHPEQSGGNPRLAA